MRLRFCCFFFAIGLSVSLSFSQTLAVAPNETGPRPLAPPPAMSHDGSIRDLDSIGNRNIGCNRGFGNWYTLDRQMAMGKDYSTQIESTSKLMKDPTIVEYVNRIGQNLVRNSDSQVPFTIKVIESDDVNAFALPGGYFYVDTGRSWRQTMKRNWPVLWRTRLRMLLPVTPRAAGRADNS